MKSKDDTNCIEEHAAQERSHRRSGKSFLMIMMRLSFIMGVPPEVGKLLKGIPAIGLKCFEDPIVLITIRKV